MTRRSAAGLAALLLTMLASLTVPTRAMAETDAATAALCADHNRPCAIQVDPAVRESVNYKVTVRGAAGTATSIQAYRVKLNGDQIAELVPYSTPQPVTLNADGVASTGVGLPALPDDQAGGFLLVTLTGMKGTDVSRMVGSFAVLGALSPMLLGDGYGEQKPVGQVLDLQYYAAIGFLRFAVDYASDDGSWHEVTSPTQPGDMSTTMDAIGHVRYTVPRGLQQKSYRFRLRNITVNRVVASWDVIPSVSPPTQTRTGVWSPPPVGSAIGNAAVGRSHDSGLVKGMATGIVVACLLVCAVSSVLAGRRRSLLLRAARS